MIECCIGQSGNLSSQRIKSSYPATVSHLEFPRASKTPEHQEYLTPLRIYYRRWRKILRWAWRCPVHSPREWTNGRAETGGLVKLFLEFGADEYTYIAYGSIHSSPYAIMHARCVSQEIDCYDFARRRLGLYWAEIPPSLCFILRREFNIGELFFMIRCECFFPICDKLLSYNRITLASAPEVNALQSRIECDPTWR